MVRTDEIVLATAVEAYSVCDLLRRLGLSETGANHQHYKIKLAKLGFGGFKERLAGTNRPRSTTGLDSLKAVLVRGAKPGGSDLRHRLVKYGLLQNACNECGQGPVWRDRQLSLHLDHIDGDRCNNRLDNLRILCPNCHSQTETYGKVKNPPPGTLSERLRARSGKKCSCGAALLKRNKSGSCGDCYRSEIPKKSQRPPLEELLADVDNIGYSATGRKHGVSDTTVRKWLRLG